MYANQGNCSTSEKIIHTFSALSLLYLFQILIDEHKYQCCGMQSF